MSINWKIGVYESEAANGSQTTTHVTIASDWAAIRDYADLILDEPLAVYGDLLPLLCESDLNLVNVECTLGEKGEPIRKGGPNLRAPAEAARSLADAPFHVACLANNHVMDFGPESLQETIEILHDAGLQTIGAGMDGEAARQPLNLNLNGTKLSIINCAEGEACAAIQNGLGANPFDVPVIEKQIQGLKRDDCAVLVIFHGGREYAPVPPVYVVEALRSFAEAGADVVVGHHPHVPQGVEIHNGVPIAYSQGNFVFRSAQTRGVHYHYRNLGYLVHLNFTENQLARFALTPYQMRSEGVYQLQDEEKIEFLQALERVSGILSTLEAVQQAWDAFVDYEGQDGMQGLLQEMLHEFDKDAPLAAARLHNIFFCPAHRELYLNGMKRLSKGELDNSPQWAKDLVQEWQKKHEP